MLISVQKDFEVERVMKKRILPLFVIAFTAANIVSAQTAKRVVTNNDLEKYKVAREGAEADYRRTYAERGMPSPEELQRQALESQKTLEALSLRLAQERQQNGSFYQQRAVDLRNQILSVDAQINYLNGQIGSVSNQNQVYFSSNQIYSVGYASGGNYGGIRNNRPQAMGTVNIASNVQAVKNASAGAPNPFYGTPLYPSSIQVVVGSNNNNRRGGRGGYYGGYYGSYGYPMITNNNSGGRDELVSRLQYLYQVRAGLIAQWNQLADDAKRAGVRID